MRSVLVIVSFVLVLLAAAAFFLRTKQTPDPTPALAQMVPVDMSQNEVSPSNETAAPLRGPVAPDISSDVWLNSAPLKPADLHGKVVLVDFWTFDCINCRNTIPQLRNWYQKYRDQGFVIVGVHSPEFSYEHDVENVKQAIQELKIPYPVALDNDFKTWNSYRVYAWPTWFIVDKRGAVRFSHVGEGAYDESEQAIMALLKE
ncbi:MAG TPA: redoxin domain-containing protein [Anaerolineae bacterium]